MHTKSSPVYHSLMFLGSQTVFYTPVADVEEVRTGHLIKSPPAGRFKSLVSFPLPPCRSWVMHAAVNFHHAHFDFTYTFGYKVISSYWIDPVKERGIFVVKLGDGLSVRGCCQGYFIPLSVTLGYLYSLFLCLFISPLIHPMLLLSIQPHVKEL